MVVVKKRLKNITNKIKDKLRKEKEKDIGISINLKKKDKKNVWTDIID